MAGPGQQRRGGGSQPGGLRRGPPGDGSRGGPPGGSRSGPPGGARGGSRGPPKGGRSGGRRPDDSKASVAWVPKTKLGKLVFSGKITTMSEALASRLPIKEPEVVDILLPDLMDEVLDVNMVQRMTDSGRRVRFAITAVVGNGDGFVGMGRAKGKEVGPAIRNAIDRAKLNMIEVKRGCGSWECGCGTPHTVPFAVVGKCGSVVVTLKPAPRGVGLALGTIAKKVVTMAGIKDSWGITKGHTKTTVNYSFAAFEALKETSKLKVTSIQAKNLHILSGPVTQVYLDTSPEEVARIIEEKKAKAREIEIREKELVDDDVSGRKPKIGKRKIEIEKVPVSGDILQEPDDASDDNETKKDSDAK
jgi:small subunit ribosomal protein S5